MALVTVSFPIYIETDNVPELKKIDFVKLANNDHDYTMQVRSQIKDMAAHFLQQGSSEPIITDCKDCPQLVE